MKSPGILQTLIDVVNMNAQFEESEAYVSSIVGDEKACAARFTLPVENTNRVFEVTVREVVVHKGLDY